MGGGGWGGICFTSTIPHGLGHGHGIYLTINIKTFLLVKAKKFDLFAKKVKNTHDI